MNFDLLPRIPRAGPAAGGGAKRFSPVLFAGLVMAGWGATLASPVHVLDAFDFSRSGGIQEKLPRVLEEISGLAATSDGRILAHGDEAARIYEIDPLTGEVVKAFFAGRGGIRGDFEGIAVVDDRIFLVTSAGEILETREGPHGSNMEYRVYGTGLGRLCEFEGLAYDPRTRSLLLPCKETRTRELQEHVVVFAVGLDPFRVYPVPRVFISFDALEALDFDHAFHPSAIEVHRETGRSILVSAREEEILEISPDGLLLAGRKLHRKSHAQPEGITFLADGTLLLADEGQGKTGRVTRYPVRNREGGTPP